MISDGNGKPESRQKDADQMMKLMELELAQKRAEWTQASHRYKTLRTASFFFLAIVIMGAMAGFFYVFTQLTGGRPAAPSPTPSVTPAKP